MRFESLESREVFAATPVVSIANATTAEGNSGQHNAMFVVSLDQTARRNITVNVATSSGTATSGSDFVALSKQITIARGQRSVQVPVSIFGDTLVESSETFKVTLSSANNARLGSSVATGTITNDDSATTPPPTTPPPTTPPASGTYGLSGPIGPQQGVAAPAGAIVLSASSGTAANQRLLDSSPAGSTFYFNAGTYTDLSIYARPGNKYVGAFGAILKSTTKQYAISGSGTSAAPITVSNLTFNGYAAPPQRSVVQGGDYFRIDHVEVLNSPTGGVLLGSHSSLSDSYVHDNGQLGIKAFSTDNACTDVVLSNTRVSRNNLAHAYDFQNEAGGSKFWNVNGLTITRCEFDGNVGDGIWMDGNLAGGGCTNVTISGNWTHDNGRYGIFQEIGGKASITGNLSERNGVSGLLKADGQNADGAGIQLDNSESVTISGNIVRNNYNGIVLQSYIRSDTSHRVRNNTITNNTITMTRGITGVRDDISLVSGITFDYNTYDFSGSSTFAWGQLWNRTWAQWQALGFDVHGTIVRH